MDKRTLGGLHTCMTPVDWIDSFITSLMLSCTAPLSSKEMKSSTKRGLIIIIPDVQKAYVTIDMLSCIDRRS